MPLLPPLSVAQAQQVVECSNCGGTGAEVWIAIGGAVLAALGVGVAVVAAVYAKRAADAADESLGLARDEVAMGREEHNVFLRGLNARARFTLTARPLEADDDGVLRTDAARVFVRIEVGIANVGDKAAGPTTLNVLVPAGLDARWCGPGGEELPGVGAAAAGERLIDPNRREVAAVFLSQTLPRVGRRDHPVRFVRFWAELKPGRNSVPLRIYASADELPDDEDEPVLDETIQIEQRAA